MLEHDEGFRELHYDEDSEDYEEASQYWLISDYLTSLVQRLGKTVFQMKNGNVYFRFADGVSLANDKTFLDAIALIDGAPAQDNEQIEKR